MPPKKRYSAFEDLTGSSKDQQKVQPAVPVEQESVTASGGTDRTPQTQPDATRPFSAATPAASRGQG